MSVRTKPMEAKPTRVAPAAECCEQACLERLRAFPGMPLTDLDLTIEDLYFRERLRLHNRDVHGWGVVCGLEVTCHPRSEKCVLVHPGHAIDCCGNDIVLCQAEPFDVIGYLKQQAKQVEPDCRPIATKTAKKESNPCAGAGREYCLVLSYAEEQTRPIAALMGGNGGRVSRCEPSRIKETFQLDLVERIRIERGHVPTLLERVCTCIESVAKDAVMTNIWKQIQAEPTHKELLKHFCAFRDYIQDLYTRNPYNIRCNVCAELHAIKFPLQTESEDSSKLWTAFATLFGYMAQYLLDCICHQLLVPCPACVPSEHVVLACITVDGDVVADICNLSRRWQPSSLVMQRQEREMLRSLFPLVKEWLPKWDSAGTLEDALERLCCEDLTTLFVEPKPASLAEFRNELSDRLNRLQGTYGQAMEVCGGYTGWSYEGG